MALVNHDDVPGHQTGAGMPAWSYAAPAPAYIENTSPSSFPTASASLPWLLPHHPWSQPELAATALLSQDTPELRTNDVDVAGHQIGARTPVAYLQNTSPWHLQYHPWHQLEPVATGLLSQGTPELRSNDVDVAGHQTGARTPSAHLEDASSWHLQYHPRCQPDPATALLSRDIPELGHNDIDDDLFAMIRNLPTSPPRATPPVAPFVQPAMPSPRPLALAPPVAPFALPAMPSPPLLAAPQVAPFALPAMPPPPQQQMQTDIQMQYYNHQPTAMVPMAMQGSHRNCRPWQTMAALAPVQASAFAASHRAVPLPADAPPAGEPAKRPRGRPRGSTAAASKSKLANAAATSRQKTAPRRTDPAAMTGQERPTEKQPAAATSSAIVVAQHHGELEDCRDKRKRTEGTVHTGGEAVQEVKHADTRPTGVRFRPTAVELIGYLRLKYVGGKMPVDFIKEFDVCNNHPNAVQEMCGNKVDGSWYVFSPRDKKYPRGRRPARTVWTTGVKIGYWKSNTNEADIIDGGIEIGKVNTLTFQLGHQPKGKATSWKMKQYRIPENQEETFGSSMLLDPWVLCKIFRRDEDQQVAPVETGDGQSAVVADEHAKKTDGGGDEGAADENERSNDPEQDLSVEDFPSDNGREGSVDLCVDDYVVSYDPFAYEQNPLDKLIK